MLLVVLLSEFSYLQLFFFFSYQTKPLIPQDFVLTHLLSYCVLQCLVPDEKVPSFSLLPFLSRANFQSPLSGCSPSSPSDQPWSKPTLSYSPIWILPLLRLCTQTGNKIWNLYLTFPVLCLFPPSSINNLNILQLPLYLSISMCSATVLFWIAQPLLNFTMSS